MKEVRPCTSRTACNDILLFVCVFHITKGRAGDQGLLGQDGEPGSPGAPGRIGLPGFRGSPGLPVGFHHNYSVFCMTVNIVFLLWTEWLLLPGKCSQRTGWRQRFRRCAWSSRIGRPEGRAGWRLHWHQRRTWVTRWRWPPRLWWSCRNTWEPRWVSTKQTWPHSITALHMSFDALSLYSNFTHFHFY